MKFNKVSIKRIIPVLSIIFLTNLTLSCSPKSGCPATEEATAKVNRRGELSTKRGKSALFSAKGAVKVKKAQKQRKKQRQKKYAKRRS